MRTFEFRQGKSKKFWNIELRGRRYTVTFGGIGTAGQTQTREFADEAKAQAAHDKLIAEKVKKGYRETTPVAAAPAARRFEFDDGKSQKFWAVELQGDSFTVTYGRIGAAGQAQTKQFADADRARKECDKLIAQKLAKGYVEKAPTTAPPIQQALEQALAENPDDLAAHMAYADCLMEQGDPRGEFIQVQLALEDPARTARERKGLRGREAALLKKHARAWLGDLAPTLLGRHGVKYQFSRGWLDSLDIPELSLSNARALARTPQARLLRHLAVGRALDPEEDEEEGPQGHAADDVPEEVDERVAALYPLLRSANLKNVGVFRLGEPTDPDDFGNTWTGGWGVTVPLVRSMPRLEELYLLAHLADDDLTALFGLKTLHSLRVLQVYHAECRYPLEVLARNASLTRLTHLWLRPHGHGLNVPASGAYIDLDGVRAVLRSPHLKNLTHLRIQLCNMGDKGCGEILRSGILKRLKVLELQYGEITDDGACQLAACPDVDHLERLDLSHNSLSEDGREVLADLPLQVRTDDQFGPGQEGEYLSYGDME
jgi:uncharacterized protein (TIGR02996 family)